MQTVVILNGSTMGHGDRDLGGRILKTLLGKIRALRGLEAIVLYNSAVKLLTHGSPCLPALGALDQAGVDLIACGTCVDHYELRGCIHVGEVGSMDTILATIDRAEKVVTI